MRGRVAGFLDGTAKRAGAVLGGLIAALLVGAPTAFYVVMAIAGAVWLAASTRIARELPMLAIELPPDQGNDVDAIVDARSIDMLVGSPASTPSVRPSSLRVCTSAAASTRCCRSSARSATKVHRAGSRSGDR
ncbi:MAG: hypothetical protein WKG01_34355 [Kofleriaceae bacterium]